MRVWNRHNHSAILALHRRERVRRDTNGTLHIT
jgi:hypothetical protein